MIIGDKQMQALIRINLQDFYKVEKTKRADAENDIYIIKKANIKFRIDNFTYMKPEITFFDTLKMKDIFLWELDEKRLEQLVNLTDFYLINKNITIENKNKNLELIFDEINEHIK